MNTLLRKGLAERESGVQVTRVGRGQLQLAVTCPISLERGEALSY